MTRQLPEPIRPDDFASFMRAYQDMVFTTAARITGNDRHAEDIAQDVFLKAYESFDQLRDSPSTGGWLKTVATNLSLNYISRYRRRWRFFSELRGGDPDERDPELDFALPDDLLAGIDAESRREVLDDVLKRLPEHQRVPLVLYHFEEMSYDEIAGRLRISLAKVKIDILRGRAALAKILLRRGVTACGIGT